jgi:hypothetical protein
MPLVHAARHNDVKPLLGRELMILTHDDDDVCMYVCMLLVSEKTLKRVEYNCIGGGGSYKEGAVPPTDLRGIAQ